MEKNASKIDKTRIVVLTAAELFDAWRAVPRALVVGYGWLCWAIVDWYMQLEPSLLEGCDMNQFADMCIIAAPTTQHAALVTAVVGCAAGVFGLYTNGGRKWSREKFVRWDDTNIQKNLRQEALDLTSPEMSGDDVWDVVPEQDDWNDHDRDHDHDHNGGGHGHRRKRKWR